MIKAGFLNRKKPYYGHPLHLISKAIFIIIFLLVLLIVVVYFRVSYFFMIPLIILFLLVIFSIYFFEKNFRKMRKMTINNILKYADLKGDEKILDLGTGSGFLSINLAKHLKNGKVYGIDKWGWCSKIKSKMFTRMLFMSGKKTAEKNADIENVKDKCVFINGSFTEKMIFSDKYFDVICSSQSLYFLRDLKNQKFVFKEIDRILVDGGKIVIVEPKKYEDTWDIENAKIFFEKNNYEVNLILLSLPRGWADICVLQAKKQM